VKEIIPTFDTYLKESLNEGGWYSTKTQGTKLTPAVIKECVPIIEAFFKKFAKRLSEDELPPLVPVRPMGSGVYYEADLTDDPDKIYGDIDYLVEYPLLKTSDDFTRKDEIDAVKLYNQTLLDWIKNIRPNELDVDETLRISNESVVTPFFHTSNGLIQIDILITHGSFKEWAIGRLTPVRNLKGFTIGNLYSALGDTLEINLGTRGVRAKFENDVLAPWGKKRNLEEKIVSLNFNNFLLDIAKFLYTHSGKTDSYKETENLLKNPGLNPSDITLENFCVGIKSLTENLEDNGLFDGKFLTYSSADDLNLRIKTLFVEKILAAISNSKFDKAETPAALLAVEKVKKHAKVAIEIVSANL
jgi:hypothetical protein